MAVDRFIVFKKENIPSVSRIITLIEGYLGDLGTIVDEREEFRRIIIILPGEPSCPFKSLISGSRQFEINLTGLSCHFDRAEDLWNKDAEPLYDEMGPNIDVITRMVDPLTDAVAQGFAELVARFYGAELQS